MTKISDLSIAEKKELCDYWLSNLGSLESTTLQAEQLMNDKVLLSVTKTLTDVEKSEIIELTNKATISRQQLIKANSILKEVQEQISNYYLDFETSDSVDSTDLMDNIKITKK